MSLCRDQAAKFVREAREGGEVLSPEDWSIVLPAATAFTLLWLLAEQV